MTKKRLCRLPFPFFRVIKAHPLTIFAVSLLLRSYLEEKMESGGDYVFKHLCSEETDSPAVIVTKKYRDYQRKRLELCPQQKKNDSCSHPHVNQKLNPHFHCCDWICFTSVRYKKTVRIDEGDCAVKQWILADIKASKKSKIWYVKMLAWNEEAIKFATLLPKETRVLILNFLVKGRLRSSDYTGQSPYEIRFTARTTFSIID